ncbi:MAG: hypothetical protein PF690_08060 [Deltaproteobacteria bacterium]|nr:hypothetical protein [Deltaproteobacteria bacterium]
MIKFKQTINILILLALIFICGCVSSNDQRTAQQKIKDDIHSYPGKKTMKETGRTDKQYLLPIYSALQNKQYNSAINQAEKLRTIHPGDEDIFYLQGIAYFEKTEFSKALHYFEKTTSMNSNRGDAFFYKAMVLTKLNKPKIALDAINTAINNKNAALQLVKQEQLRFKGTWTVGGRRAALFFMRAVINKSLGHLNNALSDINTAISLSPYQSSSHFETRGDINFLKTEYSLAYTDFKKAVELDPEKGKVWLVMGAIDLYRGSYDRAITNFNKAVKINPERYNGALANSAIALWIKGEKNSALEALGGAIKKKPNAHMYYHLAYFHHLMGNRAQALANFQKAEQLKSNILKLRSQFLKRPPKASPTYTFYQQEYKTAQLYLKEGNPVAAGNDINRSPSLKITDLNYEPIPLPVNTAFGVICRFKPDIPKMGNNIIPVTFYFKVYRGSKVVFTSKHYTVNARNNKVAKWVQHMNPFSKKRAYIFKAFVKYKNISDNKSITLTIK